jgi:hypothetical protein
MFDGEADRPDALDQELAGLLALAPVDQERLPLLEAGVAAADGHGLPQPRFS